MINLINNRSDSKLFEVCGIAALHLFLNALMLLVYYYQGTILLNGSVLYMEHLLKQALALYAFVLLRKLLSSLFCGQYFLFLMNFTEHNCCGSHFHLLELRRTIAFPLLKNEKNRRKSTIERFDNII